MNAWSLLCRAWGLAEPCELRPLSAGYMNLTHAVTAPGGRYVLRVYQAVSDRARIEHEHALTQWLQAQAGLSFAVPAPIATGDGRTLVQAGSALAALMPFLPGQHPRWESVPQTEAMGAALGELSAVLARLPRAFVPAGIPRYGQLERVHPAVPDPLACMARLPVPEAERERLRALVQEVMALVPTLYETLPQQAIHGDPTRENLLVADDRVSAVLDFEFSGWDLRALDFATALGGGPDALWAKGAGWTLVDAFARGYFAGQRLTPAEVAALPALVRLRRAERLMQFMGRWRQGYDSGALVGTIAGWVLRADDWLREHGGELVARMQHLALHGR